MTFSAILQTPSISMSPPAPLTDGENFTLTCMTSFGLASVFYVWNVDGADLSGSSSSTLAVAAVDIANVQVYRCKVSADGGSSYSDYSSPFTPEGRFKYL